MSSNGWGDPPSYIATGTTSTVRVGVAVRGSVFFVMVCSFFRYWGGLCDGRGLGGGGWDESRCGSDRAYFVIAFLCGGGLI